MMRRLDFNSFLAVSAASLLFDDPLKAALPARKILAIGDVHRKIYQHDAVSRTMATIFDLRRKSGLYDTYIRTDIQLLTKHPITFPEASAVPDVNGNDVNYKMLNDFDAVFFYGSGELELTDQQKADLLSFIHDDGKGFIGCHTAITAFYKWPKYDAMIGGYFDDHSWTTFDVPIIVEDESWDDPRIEAMWLEAVKWGMGLTEADGTPRPRPLS